MSNTIIQGWISISSTRNLQNLVEMVWGGVVVCLLAVTQAIGTVVLFARRKIHTDWDDHLLIDTFNGVTAFSSAISGIVAILILLTRLEWQVISRPVQTEIFEHPRLTAMGIQLMIAFVCTGWIRGYLIWNLSYVLSGMGHLFELVIVGLLAYIFRRDIFKRIGFSLRAAGSFILCVLTLVIAGDFVMSIVISISELDSVGNGGWKDPLEDKILVI
jgi:hypothetical protein